jgi:membrane associated rhomboid family serine protease
LDWTFVPFAVLAVLPFAVAAARKGWVSQWLIVANMAIFIYMFALAYLAPSAFEALFDDVAFNSSRPFGIGLAASMFVHADMLHLLGNMLVLYFIGVSLEERVGTPKTTAVYLATGIIATVGYALLHWGRDFALVGASGAVSGLMGALLVLYPRDNISMFVGPIFLRRVPVWIAVGAFFGMEAFLTFVSFPGDNVAHAAHITGLLAGLGLGALLGRPAPRDESGADKSSAILALLSLARDPRAVEALERARSEDLGDVRAAWLERGLALVNCPGCGGGLRATATGVECRACGASYGPGRPERRREV